MLGDASFRLTMQVLGYAYPGYLTFKDIEHGDGRRIELWCMYWVIMAALTALQPFLDTFLFFVPFYYSLKLAFACYLWMNNLQGAEHVYREYVRPMVRRHEPLVDFKLMQMRALVSQMVSSNMSKAVQYVQMLLVKTLSQSVAEQEGGRRPNMTRDESASFHTAQDFSRHDRESDAYFDRKTSPLRAGGSGRR